MTHSRRGDVRLIPPVIFHHLVDAVIVSYEERRVLPRRVEVSSACDWGSLDATAR